MLKGFFSVAMGVSIISSPLYGQSQESSLEAAKRMLKSGHPDQSLVLVEPIIAEAMLKDAKDPDAIALALLPPFFRAI